MITPIVPSTWPSSSSAASRAAEARSCSGTMETIGSMPDVRTARAGEASGSARASTRADTAAISVELR